MGIIRLTTIETSVYKRIRTKKSKSKVCAYRNNCGKPGIEKLIFEI